MAVDLLTGKRSGRNWALGASLTTSKEDVEDRLRSLRVDTDNLNVDISQWFPPHKGELAARKFVDAWVRWRDETYKFIKSWKEGWGIHLAWNFMDNGNQRITELADWRARWERLSGEKATAPATKAPEKKESGGIWKWVAVAALGAVGAGIVAKKLGT